MVGCWLVLIVATQLVESQTGTSVPVCLLRRTTGVPCPTCGSTRAARAALDGAFLDAFLFNPLVVTGGLVIGGLLGLRLVTGYRLVWPEARWVGVVVGVIAVVANWVWVIARDGIG